MRKIVAAFAIAAATGANIAHADAPKSELAAAEVAKVIAFFDQLVEAVVASKDDCPKMANQVASVIGANKVVIELAEKARKANKKLPRAAQEHMLEGAKRMVPAMQKCGGDADVQKAFKQLEPK